MAKCEEGYLCEVCGCDVEEISDSDLYLRFVIGEGYRPLLYLVILLMGIGMGLFMMGFMAEGLTALREEIGDMRKKLQKTQSRKDDAPSKD